MPPATSPTGSGLPVRCIMVSIVVLSDDADSTRMLVLRRAGDYLKGIWSYVAGHVAEGETGRQAALRELREETGLVPEALYATGFCEQFYAAGDNCIEIVPAFVARVAETAEVRLNAEHSAFRWVSLPDAADLLPFGSQRDLIAHVRREFIERQPSPFLRMPPD